jgi:hypothetical protein
VAEHEDKKQASDGSRNDPRNASAHWPNLLFFAAGPFPHHAGQAQQASIRA